MPHAFSSRTSYHTNLKLAGHAGILPTEIASRIPKSTRSTWKNLDPTRFFGSDDAEFIKSDRAEAHGSV